ncbi:conserved hypothetical protein [Cupriavidus taiwanensis]|nr:conserved hypothetical protein [Cupriavidus taiwanensis]
MFVCGNQACGARWKQDEVQIRDEGQGPVFRCPQCGARNHVKARKAADGSTTYRQVPAKAAGNTAGNAAEKAAGTSAEKPAVKRAARAQAKAPAPGRAKHGAKPAQR